MSSSTTPTIILVPGAWHFGTIHYTTITSSLEKAGYEVIALDLPSTCDQPHPDSWKHDIDHIAQQIEKTADEGKDVLLVMHSRGGIAGGDACEGLSKADREKTGKKGGVVRCVFIAAFAASEGQTLFLASRGPDLWLDMKSRGKGIAFPENVAEIFYNDCTPEQIEEAKKHIKPISTSVFVSPAKYAACHHIPSTYLLCEKDNAIPIYAQEAMSSQPGSNFDHIERCSASHSPFLSMPDYTTEVIRRAAGEQI
ncbi:hypothetical protein LTR78_005545 [Recurvomyces mirabilis]|uniref:AB hydrolase-1 domain-containing protein n=1 Tax=Recurvomyces mirabilis TaxID=574656 RepID=A0AAE1C1A3_9PEZI|nr:hypothetical protein LTR78_005545 [Recurvomyces mirabilis]